MKKTIILFLGILLSFVSLKAQWTQIGSDIVGEEDYESLGYSTSLSADGSIIAVSLRKGTDGAVRIFENLDNIWTQVGSDIDTLDDHFGFGATISLNAEGTIIAIGAPGRSDEDTFGYTSIYKNINNN